METLNYTPRSLIFNGIGAGIYLTHRGIDLDLQEDNVRVSIKHAGFQVKICYLAAYLLKGLF